MTPSSHPSGPLHGLRVIEMAGIGPAPYCGMLLADMGADVIVIERPASQRGLNAGTSMNRGKRSVCLDLKQEAGLHACKTLIHTATALIEGYRPGVMERLGLGPAVFEASHPRLIYGRATGWGQSGPLAHAAGHDINYVALTGLSALAARPGCAPSLPATVIGDMAGGGMFLAFGLLCAILESQRSGQGQVVDAAMIDGVGSLGSLIHSMRGSGLWPKHETQNLFMHQSPFYDAFECADGGFITLGAIEPQFFKEMLRLLELNDVDPASQFDTKQWPDLRARVAERVRSRTRSEWTQAMEGSEACFAPVLSLDEAAEHPHQQARGNFQRINGHWQAAAAPRFSRSQPRAPQAGPEAGCHTLEVLSELDLPAEVLDQASMQTQASL